MNDKFKILIGAGVGGCIGWFIGAVIAEYLVAKAELEKRGDYDYDSTEEFPQDGEDASNPVLLKEKEMGKQSKKKTNGHDYTAHFIGNKKDGLKELAQKYGVVGAEKLGEVETKPDVNDDDFIDVPEGPDTDPAIISVEEFVDNDEQFEVIELLFYDDDVVVDENDNPVEGIDKILGDEALLSFGIDSGDEDIVYVRNRKLKAVYEVTRLNKNYGVEAPDEEPEQPIRRRTPLSKLNRLVEDDNGTPDVNT